MDRLDSVRKEMAKKGAQSLLISSEQNRFYVSRFDSSAGYVLVTDNKAWFLSDFRYQEAAKTALKGFEFIKTEKNPEEELCELIRSVKLENMLFEDASMTYKKYSAIKGLLPNVELMSEDGMLAGLRMKKDDDEIELISRAQQISESAFLHILEVLKEGMTEKEIASVIECHMSKMGADGLAFKTIALAGENASMPHGVPGDRKIKAGDMLTVDFGCKVGGYCSDMTRTIALGRVSDEQKKAHDTVLRAQTDCLDRIKAGIKGSDCHKIALDIIEGTGYKGCFGHGLGHGVGIDIHESPSFSPNYESEICENAVMSVEPGIYVAGVLGVRIEDLVVVKKDSVYNLNSTSKEFIVL